MTMVINNCYGQRYIGCALKEGCIKVNGTPGNALGAYLDGGVIDVNGNAQDAVGDTMNDGKIIIRGNAGDALGYAMRGGEIFVRNNAGYRTGIHMKEYKDKKPAIIIGGRVGSFLGEYLAGGLIVVLGIGSEDVPVGNFTGTGMHGGKIFIRTDKELKNLPAQVAANVASEDDLKEIEPYINEYCSHFKTEPKSISNGKFYILTPNAKNPYKQLYTAN
ncbi:MAG: glutamate synthase [Oscillospiraceae bacterium]|nr:glutamate synthase [Oscillospiraceae bacterium]